MKNHIVQIEETKPGVKTVKITAAKQTRMAETPSDNPNNLINKLIQLLKVKNDAALAYELDVAPAVISKIRHRRIPVGPSMLVRMHEISGLSVRELRLLMEAKHPDL